jgi:predicted permease
MAMCRSWKAWAVFGAVVVAVAIVAPGTRAAVLPLLVVAACPLSMLAMGVGMARAAKSATREDDGTPAGVDTRDGALR